MSGTTPTPGSEPGDGNNPYAQPGDASRPLEQPSADVPPAWSGPATEPIRPTPPRSVLTAVKLMYVGAALAVIQGLLFLILTDRDELRDIILETSPDFSEDELDAAVGFSMGITIVVLVISVFFWLWLAAKNKQGRSWARIVATVLGALNAVYLLYVLAGGGLSGLALLVNVVSVALAALILWYLWRPESGEYYTAVTKARTLQ